MEAFDIVYMVKDIIKQSITTLKPHKNDNLAANRLCNIKIMSQKETWRTRKYWSQVGGLLVEEFLAVKGTKNSGRRPIDGLIVLNEKKGIHTDNFYDIEGKDVIVIQTKHNRIGMYLLGQAFFSKFLIERFNPRSIKCLAICGKYDEVIGELAKKHEVEVVVIQDNEYDEKYDSLIYVEKNKTLYNNG